MVVVKLRASLPPGHTSKSNTVDPHVTFCWVEGTGVQNYATSAKSWLEFTQRPEFVDRLKALVNAANSKNDDRAAAVEEFILQQATTAGVVKKIITTHPKNPNKWGKTLAPWFTEECREAKKGLAEARRTYGKGHARIVSALKTYHKMCLKGRKEFARSTPDMLKYQPKRFWGLLRKK
jgi:hypothetical protein